MTTGDHNGRSASTHEAAAVPSDHAHQSAHQPDHTPPRTPHQTDHNALGQHDLGHSDPDQNDPARAGTTRPSASSDDAHAGAPSAQPSGPSSGQSPAPRPAKPRTRGEPELSEREIWTQMQAFLRQRHTDLCRAWFSELTPLGLGDGCFWIRAHSDTHRDYLRRDCLDAFNAAASHVTGRLDPVRFLGPDEPWAPPPTRREPARPQAPAPEHTLPDIDSAAESQIEARPAAFIPSERAHAERPESLRLNPDFTFEQFIVGPNNRFAHAAAVAVSQRPGKVYNPIFIHGGVGLGKTHLLQAICIQIRRQTPDSRIHYVSCETFVTHFMQAVRSGEMTVFHNEFRDLDVLVIDDIHLLGTRERTQEEFFHTFNALYQAQKQIVLSSDAPPEEIPDLEARVTSRFKWGLVAEIEPPSFETRVAIVHAKAAMRGFNIPDQAAQFVAHHVDSNIRELEGAVITLQMRCELDNQPLTLATAREALGKPATDRDGPTVEHVIGVVTEFYNVKRMDVLGKRRLKSVVLPRQAAMYLARQLTRLSLEEIGANFGGRDHSTVIHAVRVVTERIENDAEFAERMKLLETRCRRGL